VLKSLESSKTELDGEQRTLYRLLLEDPKAGFNGELVLDRKRMLPLLVRANLGPAENPREKFFWQAQWRFGGAHDPKLFELPESF
ncbi:MAG: hypothetical protein MH204_04405, partial [Fimbriimonadaceae bacterium]|nr:hypothetical protein [Fimbriimonadaceae bacterium]